MSDLKEEFQATVADIAEDARELERLENEKAGLDPADPEARSLSRRADELAEQDLAETAAADG